MASVHRDGWIDQFAKSKNSDWWKAIKDTTTIEADILAPQNNALVSQHFNRLLYYAYQNRESDNPREALIAKAIMNGLLAKWLQDNHNTNRNMQENTLELTRNMLDKFQRQENSRIFKTKKASKPAAPANSQFFASPAKKAPASTGPTFSQSTTSMWAPATLRQLDPNAYDEPGIRNKARRK